MLRFVKRKAPSLTRAEGLPPWLSELLALRGVDTAQKAQAFLHPSLDQLHDPFLMRGMGEAIGLIQRAINENEAIVVYGDYDVDGVCAAVMMTSALRLLGGHADYYIPSRHEEGYGLNEDAVKKLSEKYRLMITVDCGITAIKETDLAKELGMLVIITDHHQPGPELPLADAVLNPLISGYPFPHLCGAGVALKVLQALGGLGLCAEYIDLAALATVADLVPLLHENRAIAAVGLAAAADTQKVGLRALMEVAGIQPGSPLTSSQAAYQLAPRLNAGGRLQSASLGAELLLTEDEQRARELALALNEQNEMRRKLEADIVAQAIALVEQDTSFADDAAIVVMGECWNSGVIGLAAGRLVQRFYKPSIVLSQNGEECVGSVRSIPGVNIHQMLSMCKDLFVRFGGHEQAAGLTIPTRHVPEFRHRLNKAIRENCAPEVFIPFAEYDLVLPLSQVDLPMARTLAGLEPTGMGNPEPVFLLHNAQVQDMRPVGRDGAHLKCSLYQSGTLKDAIGFQMGPLAKDLPERTDVLFSPQINEYLGSVKVQCLLKHVLPADEAEDVAAPAPRKTFHQEGLQENTALA